MVKFKQHIINYTQINEPAILLIVYLLVEDLTRAKIEMEFFNYKYYGDCKLVQVIEE